MPVPVDRVGGAQDAGPWDPAVDEIAAGNTYQRQVVAADGTPATVAVTVTTVQELLDAAGEPTGAYVHAFTFDDPALDGGSQ